MEDGPRGAHMYGLPSVLLVSISPVRKQVSWEDVLMLGDVLVIPDDRPKGADA